MSLEQKTYEKGWAKCRFCGIRRPEINLLALTDGTRSCEPCVREHFPDVPQFRARIVAVADLPKGGGK